MKSTATTLIMFVLLCSHDLQGQSTSRVSLSSDGVQGNGDSRNGSLSADGRFVSFWSYANNLVPGDTDGLSHSDAFVRDRLTGKTECVSVSTEGVQGLGDTYSSSISDDGRFVAFSSMANNLVSDDTNGVPDVFVHDRNTGQTTRISVSPTGEQGNDWSSGPRVSADGRYVAFGSDASNLVPGDTNGRYDIFVYDRETGQSTRVSLSSSGEQGNFDSVKDRISDDGRFVAFRSAATNLVSGDTNGDQDIFMHDRESGQTTRVSVSSTGEQSDSQNDDFDISADGRYVAIESYATNLAPGDTNGVKDIFVHDRQTGQTTRVSVSSSGSQANSYSYRPCLSADGRYVVFESDASNLVSGDTNGERDCFVHDRQTGKTTLVSWSATGKQGNAFSGETSISADGRYVAFSSDATKLVPGDTNARSDVFIRDRDLLGLADISGDGAVNIQDLLAVLLSWGPCPSPPTSCPADINPAPIRDGVVDAEDLLMVINSWG